MANTPEHPTVAAFDIASAESIRSTMNLNNVLAANSSPGHHVPDGLAAFDSPSTSAIGISTTPPATVELSTPTPAPAKQASVPSTPASDKKESAASTPAATPRELDSPASEAAEHDGDSDNSGDDVPDSEREFICMNDEHSRCKTGQYTLDLSRKVISDHFGRNKACTKGITSWPLFCRKHYQRATYNKSKWQKRKIQLIIRQLDVIEEEFPGTTYNVNFKKSEEARLNKYSRSVSKGLSSAQAAATVKPCDGKAFEAPIDVLRELDEAIIGKNQPASKVKDAMDIIAQMLEEEDVDQVPSIEFLPQLPAKSSIQKSSAKGRASQASKSPSRVSGKGAVKKTSQKA